jgi:hypothetical protein
VNADSTYRPESEVPDEEPEVGERSRTAEWELKRDGMF